MFKHMFPFLMRPDVEFCTRLCIIHFFLCGLSALDRAALIGEEICERITNQQTPNFGAGYARTTDGAGVPSG